MIIIMKRCLPPRLLAAPRPPALPLRGKLL